MCLVRLADLVLPETPERDLGERVSILSYDPSADKLRTGDLSSQSADDRVSVATCSARQRGQEPPGTETLTRSPLTHMLS